MKKKEEQIALTQRLWYKKAGYQYLCLILMSNTFQKVIATPF